MTSEEIIERLLDEKKISVKEALIILKDLARIGITQSWRSIFPESGSPTEVPDFHPAVVMYGVQTSPATWNSLEGESTSASTYSNDSSKTK